MSSDNSFKVLVGCTVHKDSNEYQGAEKNRFKLEDQVVVHGLRRKKRWNREYALIIGPYQQRTGIINYSSRS